MAKQLEKSFCRGEVIIKEGQPGSTFFVILSGMVEVLKRKEGHDVVIGVLGQNEFFGEMSLIDEESGKRCASVRALEDTRVAIMGKEDLEKYLGKLTPGVRKMLSRLSDRLRTTNSLVDDGAYRHELVKEEESLDFTMTLDELEKSRDHAVGCQLHEQKIPPGTGDYPPGAERPVWFHCKSRSAPGLASLGRRGGGIGRAGRGGYPG